MMTTPEFDTALDRWGADLEQWPPDTARQARALLAADPAAGAALAAARRVDDHLAGLRRHTVPDYLAARITGRALERAGHPDLLERALGWLSGRLWRPALAALAITAVGYLAGTTLAQPEVDAALAEDVMTLAFSDLYSELEDAQP